MQPTRQTSIQWALPPLRSGIAGLVDSVIGPGSTRAEQVLQVMVPAVAMVAAIGWARHTEPSWQWFHYLLCGVFGFDIVGGILTNATSSAKRWYHRQGQGFWNHISFVAIHLIHLFLVCWLFMGLNLAWFLVSAGYLLIAALLILRAPLYLQRPIAYLSYAGSVPLTLFFLKAPLGLEWFLPLFYLKLLVSHLPFEEPYRPH